MGIIFRNGIKYSGTRVVDDADHLFAEDTTGTSVSAQTMLNNILGDFATMEDSVAQENHSVGDYIVLGSYFYKVTDAITAGDTFVEGVNGNIERTNVGAELANKSPTFLYKWYSFSNLTQIATIYSYYMEIANVKTLAGLPANASIVNANLAGWTGLGTSGAVNVSLAGADTIYVLFTGGTTITSSSRVTVRFIYFV